MPNSDFCQNVEGEKKLTSPPVRLARATTESGLIPHNLWICLITPASSSEYCNMNRLTTGVFFGESWFFTDIKLSQPVRTRPERAMCHASSCCLRLPANPLCLVHETDDTFGRHAAIPLNDYQQPATGLCIVDISSSRSSSFNSCSSGKQSVLHSDIITFKIRSGGFWEHGTGPVRRIKTTAV